MEVIQYTLAFIVAIGVLVTIHEFGHFWVARKLGVKVLRFSVGFGKPLIKRNDKQGTEFVIAAIPLGGYVRMLGEQDDEITEGNRHLAFSHKSLKAKSAIVLAGPLFNFIFAIVALWALYMAGLPGQKAVIGAIEKGSIAERAGLRVNEQIVRVNNESTPTWSTANLAMLDAVIDSSRIEVDTLGVDSNYSHRYTLVVENSAPLLDEKGAIYNLGIRPWQPPVWVGDITPGSPADRAGFQTGDRVISVDSIQITDWSAWVKYIRERPAKPINVTVMRGDQEITIAVIPEAKYSDSGERYGQIGVSGHIPEAVRLKHLAEIRYGPVEALGHAMIESWDLSGLMLVILGKMVVGEASHKNISGPVKIAQFAGISASLGWEFFVRLLAVLSISLGVLNLLPIPMLDGGHLLYYVIESVRGVPLSEQAQAVGQQVGITFLALLMGLALYNDFTSLFG